jgi:hypothetical protein
MLLLIIGIILGGGIVFLAMKSPPEKSVLKQVFRTFLVVKDYLTSAMGESMRRARDLFSESKAEYEAEKRAEERAREETKRQGVSDGKE